MDKKFACLGDTGGIAMLDAKPLIYEVFRWANIHPDHFTLIIIVLGSVLILKGIFKAK